MTVHNVIILQFYLPHRYSSEYNLNTKFRRIYMMNLLKLIINLEPSYSNLKFEAFSNGIKFLSYYYIR
jgi:hypothetical protein